MNFQKLFRRTLQSSKLSRRLATKLIIQPRLALLGVPIIAITGTNGKTTIVRLLTRIYRNAGYNVGTCSTYGVTHNEKIISNLDEAWAPGAWKAAQCPNVDLLILEVARGGLIQYGLGFRKCQVGIVTNVYEDHVGYEGIYTLEQMADLKSEVPRATEKGGTIILNIDDPLVREMAGKSKATPIYFGMNVGNKDFNNIFYLKGNSIWKKIGSVEESVIDIKEIALTRYEEQRFNLANIMAILAAVEGAYKFIPVENGVITKTLREFGIRPHDNFGTFHIITLQGERVVLCNAKNPASFNFEIEVIKEIKEKEGFDYIAGILSAPGNRNKQYYQDMSDIASHACDLMLISPPKNNYLRGRPPEEIVILLSNSIPQNKLIDDDNFTLSQWISLCKSKLKGRILFVIYSPITSTKIDLNTITFKNEECKKWDVAEF